MGPVAWSGVRAGGQVCAHAPDGRAVSATRIPIIARNARSSAMRTSPSRSVAALAALPMLFACVPDRPPRLDAADGPARFEVTAGVPVEADPREVHLSNIRQLTSEG